MGMLCGGEESPEDFCREQYTKFTKGDAAGIIAARKNDESFMDVSNVSTDVPYRAEGKFVGPEKLGAFFTGIGGAWMGAENKGKQIEFKPDKFEIKGEGVVTNKVSIIQLTPDGRVVFGEETHNWTGVDPVAKKWESLTVVQDDENKLHDNAYSSDMSQAELLCKVSWKLFSEGRTDDMITHLQTKDSKFSIAMDVSDEDGAKIPYRGVFIGPKGADAFAAMGESLVMDETFKFAPTEFQSTTDENGVSTVTMKASIDCKTKAGKELKGEETHTAVVKANEDGVLQFTSWAITGAAHHAVAFPAA